MSDVVSVVLADEQPLFLGAVRELLTKEPDIEVAASADTGFDVVALARRHAPDVVVLSDGISHCGSVEAVEQIAALRPAPRILILLPREDPSRLMDTLGMGVTGYIHKASSFDELLRAIKCVSRGETYIPSQMVGPLIDRLLQSRNDAFAQWRQLEQLSRREKAVLALLAQGKNNEGIANSLVISPQTVKTHIQNILNKLGVHSRLAAIAFAMRDGVMDELVGNLSVR